MSGLGHKLVDHSKQLSLIAFISAMALLLIPACAQQPSSGTAPAVPADSVGAQTSPTGKPVLLERVVAIVNSDLILQSDVDAERRFAAFQPFTNSKPPSRDQLIQRLIDRALIFQQMALQPSVPITDSEVDAELSTLRKSIPKCAAYHCDTDAGWEKFVGDQGFTVDEMRERWRQRMDVLRFIDERFRMGIPVSQSEIDDYFKKTMLPEYQKENVTPPAEATISDRVREILLQQKVDTLLDDWLGALRAQGSVRILKPGEEAP